MHGVDGAKAQCQRQDIAGFKDVESSAPHMGDEHMDGDNPRRSQARRAFSSWTFEEAQWAKCMGE